MQPLPVASLTGLPDTVAHMDMPKYGQPFAYSLVQTLFLQTSIHAPEFTNYSNKYVVLFHGYASCKNETPILNVPSSRIFEFSNRCYIKYLADFAVTFYPVTHLNTRDTRIVQVATHSQCAKLQDLGIF